MKNNLRIFYFHCVVLTFSRDHKKYPGKVDHLSCIVIKIGGAFEEPDSNDYQSLSHDMHIQLRLDSKKSNISCKRDLLSFPVEGKFHSYFILFLLSGSELIQLLSQNKSLSLDPVVMLQKYYYDLIFLLILQRFLDLDIIHPIDLRPLHGLPETFNDKSIYYFSVLFECNHLLILCLVI